MKYSRTYIKQSNSGVVGHIYEHIAANQMINELYTRGLYRLLDYELVAETFDGIIVLRIETYQQKTMRIMNKVLSTVSFSTSHIKNAIGQIEAEYKRKSEFDTKELSNQLLALQQVPWTLSKDFRVSQPITKRARELKSSIGGFGRLAKRDFKEFEIVYKIEDCPFELKTIAVYILQVAGFIQIDGFYLKFKQSYDSGDQWAEYQDTVGYLHFLTVAKTSNLDLKKVEKQFTDTLKLMNNDEKILGKMQKFIDRSLKSEYPYFSLASSFANSYQIVGAKYLRRYNSVKNITALIEKVEYEIN
ncbi:MAG TPA: hypothetical protein VIM31_00090 [Candidatus Microsaccharimonas sp.]|jgi:hypothetical protein